MDSLIDQNDLGLILHKAQSVFMEGHYPEAQALFERALKEATLLLEKHPHDVSLLGDLRSAREGFVLAYEDNIDDVCETSALSLGLLYEEAELDHSETNSKDFLQSLDALLFLSEHLYIEEKESSSKDEEAQTLLLCQDKIGRSLTSFSDEKEQALFRTYQDAIGAYRMLFEGKDDDFLLSMSALSTSLFALSKLDPRCPVLKDGKLSMVHLYNLLEKRKGPEQGSRPEWLSLIRVYLGEKLNAEA
jgi:hypothetical protein